MYNATCTQSFHFLNSCITEALLPSVWLGDEVGWDSLDFGSWDGMNPFSVWCGDIKSGMSH